MLLEEVLHKLCPMLTLLCLLLPLLTLLCLLLPLLTLLCLLLLPGEDEGAMLMKKTRLQECMTSEPVQ